MFLKFSGGLKKILFFFLACRQNLAKSTFSAPISQIWKKKKKKKKKKPNKTHKKKKKKNPRQGLDHSIGSPFSICR
jgi:hypothetical protein